MAEARDAPPSSAQEREAARALSILLELTHRLVNQPTLDAALPHVTEAALALLPADHASIRLLDDDGALLVAARSGRSAGR